MCQPLKASKLSLEYCSSECYRLLQLNEVARKTVDRMT
jgi:hypothetical protein